MEVRDIVGPRRREKQRTVYSLSDDEKNKLKNALIEMYKTWPNVDDPAIKAEKTITKCCNATKDDGGPWLSAPNTFAGRLKNFGFDYEKFEPIEGFYQVRKYHARMTDQAPSVLPRELDVSDPKKSVNSSSFLNSNESNDARKKLKQILKDFPELDNKTDQETAMLLAKLYVIADRVMNHALETGKLSKSTNFDLIISSNIERLQKLLGIDRPSRQKAKMETEEGSIADLVKDYEYYIENNFYENETIWKIEELALLLRKYDREDETGAREIDEQIFEILSDGITVEQARQIVKNQYYDNIGQLMDELKADAKSKKEKSREEAQNLRRLFFDVPKKRRKSFKKLLALEGWNKEEIRQICSPKKKLANLAKKKKDDISD